MRSKKKNDFEGLVGRIQAASDALQQDALVVINRSVTTRAWLTVTTSSSTSSMAQTVLSMARDC